MNKRIAKKINTRRKKRKEYLRKNSIGISIPGPMLFLRAEIFFRIGVDRCVSNVYNEYIQ